MYLFTRSARLGPGNPVEQMAWAISITEKVNQISELEVTVWSRVFSPGLGTLVWTTTVEELASLEATDAKLAADSGYLSLVEQGAKYSSGDAIDDGLVQLVHADPDAAGSQPQYATVVQSIATPGSSGRAIAFGVELAVAAKKVTGRPTSFGVAATGPYGGVGWFSVYDSVEQVQKAQEALAADLSFGALVDSEAGKVYLPNVTTQTVFRRIM